MMTTIKTTKLIICHVENMTINEVHEPIKGYCDRTISIQTHEGDRYEITFWAYKPDELEFKENDFLEPKVYRGKSISEEEA